VLLNSQVDHRDVLQDVEVVGNEVGVEIQNGQDVDVYEDDQDASGPGFGHPPSYYTYSHKGRNVQRHEEPVPFYSNLLPSTYVFGLEVNLLAVSLLPSDKQSPNGQACEVSEH
jgi:hypothetical protein